MMMSSICVMTSIMTLSLRRDLIHKAKEPHQALLKSHRKHGAKFEHVSSSLKDRSEHQFDSPRDLRFSSGAYESAPDFGSPGFPIFFLSRTLPLCLVSVNE